MMPLFMVGLLVSVMFCGLALDIGLLELQRTQMQTAVDAAAIAEELNFERESSSIDGSDGSFGMAAAASYGYSNGVNGTTVTFVNSLYTAASGGDYNGHYDVIQMTISRQVPTVFMGILNDGTTTVTATAIASPPPCNYFLGTKGLAAHTVVLTTIGNSKIYVKCPAYIGGGLVVPGTSLNVWWQHFQTYITGSAGGSILTGRVKSGTTFNALPRADPLASMTQPTIGGCDHVNYSTSSTVALNAGVYCGSVNSGVVTPGMRFTHASVTLNPGLYIITGGTNWQFSNVTGKTGVTLFFTKVAGTMKYGTVSIGAGGYNGITLNAATGSALGTPVSSHALAGVVFFLDRSWVSTGPQDFVVSSSATTQGVWYMPSTGLSLQTGSGDCTAYCALIADNLYLTNFTLHQWGTDYTLYPGPNPLRTNSVLVQ